MNYLKLIEELQTHFFRQVSGYENYKFKVQQRDVAMIAKFVKWGKENYKDSFSTDFLINYFEFHYSYYSRITTRFGKGVIMLNWIVGEKARERWKDRDLKNNRYIKFSLNKNSQGYLKNLYLSSRQKQKDREKIKYILEINNLEEEFKKAFYDSEKGFLFCCQQTTLYNGNSELCRNCKFKEQCKETLKSNYPKVFKIREKYGAIR